MWAVALVARGVCLSRCTIICSAVCGPPLGRRLRAARDSLGRPVPQGIFVYVTLRFAGNKEMCAVSVPSDRCGPTAGRPHGARIRGRERGGCDFGMRLESVGGPEERGPHRRGGRGVMMVARGG